LSRLSRTAEDRTAFENADGEARFGQVAGVTSKLVLTLDLDISTVYKSSALILL
jgi:hypothetical protein